jgi:uncharacterized protein YicC (UPF0701 family)
MKSMTGFASASGEGNGFAVEVEIQSYNHRFLDIRVSLPSEFQALEQEIVRKAAARLSRGRVNISVNFQRRAGYGTVKINEELARKYYLAWKKLRNYLRIEGEIDPETLMKIPGVFSFSPGHVSPRTFKKALIGALTEALEELCRVRGKEGGRLRIDLRKHLNVLEKNLRAVEKGHRKRGKNSQPPNVDEEISRLESHLIQFADTLKESGAAGKRLEFIALEMLRETTTLGDKADDSAISSRIILMKTEIESLREQIRNVE